MANTAWQCGLDWMREPVDSMPVKTAEELVMTAEEKRLAASEMRNKDLHGHVIHVLVDKVADR
jgi:hypothetical protein